MRLKRQRGGLALLHAAAMRNQPVAFVVRLLPGTTSGNWQDQGKSASGKKARHMPVMVDWSKRTGLRAIALRGLQKGLRLLVAERLQCVVSIRPLSVMANMDVAPDFSYRVRLTGNER
jgi:hypothetical protein